MSFRSLHWKFQNQPGGGLPFLFLSHFCLQNSTRWVWYQSIFHQQLGRHSGLDMEQLEGKVMIFD